ncbi:MAG: LPS-assembly protein LptD [Gammaproteobacteria bacterium HGW-Gammaproteobacteria-3]|nr:MAG: LPS-assembly protein LptD [Gammaproteobacteria bacterium HGW-Gammaproteobacteria-3]
MYWHFFLLLALLLSCAFTRADEKVWNCEKNSVSQEWVCSSDTATGKTALPDKTPEEVNPKLTVEAVKPVTGGDDLRAIESAGTEPVVPVKPTARVKSIPAAVKQVPVRPTPIKPAPATPPQTMAQRKGWNCAINEETGTWNCNLAGSDPRGQAHVMPDEDSAGVSLLNPAFDHEQEQIFDILQSQLKYDPWANCTTSLGVPPDFVTNKDLRESSPLDIKADYSEIFDNEVTGFFGNVDITRGDQNLSGEKVHYDTVSQTLDSQGNVYYHDDTVSLYSETMLLKLATDEARLRKASFISPSTPLRGSADVVYQDSKSLTRYTEAAFTSCRPGNQDWVLHASKLKLNKASGQGSATGAWLEFKSVPVFYTPYIAFPLDNRRLSGFLAPSFGFSDKSGADISAPYYWNMAPNYDMTLRPRYLSKRGVMLAGDFRHLSKIGPSELTLELLPDDRDRPSISNSTRYLASFKNQMQLTPQLRTTIDANKVSDKDYFNDLGSNISFSDFRFLRSQAGVSYNIPGLAFFSQVESFQVVDPSITPNEIPLKRLPQIKLDLNHGFDSLPLNMALTSEYVNFQNAGSESTITEGQRFNIKPSVSMPLSTPSAFLTPRFSLQHTQYALNDQIPGASSNISRTLPIVSVDSGLFMERDFNFGQSSYIHTIEPRLFYLYIPRKDQTDIPLFDTAEFDFNFNTLFRENLFSGEDRIQDANQVTTAVTSRIINSATGQESLKFSVGEIFYLKERSVCLFFNPDGSCNVDTSLLTAPNKRVSNLITEFNAHLTDHLAFNSTVQWDHFRNELARTDLSLRYLNRPGQIVNLSYRFRQEVDGDDLLEQTDVSFRWPLIDDWYAVGRWQYSLLFNSSIESFGGFEKESCCWRFRIIGRRFVNTINTSTNQTFTGDSQTGVFVQIELKGLTAFGNKLDEFFEKNIPGYRKPEN